MFKEAHNILVPAQTMNKIKKIPLGDSAKQHLRVNPSSVDRSWTSENLGHVPPLILWDGGGRQGPGSGPRSLVATWA
jgi:hypothetical protein